MAELRSITNIGAIDLSTISPCVILNNAQAIYPCAIDTSIFGSSITTTNKTTNITFSFAQSIDKNRFDFTENKRPISNIGGIQQPNFGIAHINTKAQAIYHDAINQQLHGKAIISKNNILSNFHFGTTEHTNAANTAFYFGGKIALVEQAFTSLHIGKHELKQAIKIIPDGVNKNTLGQTLITRKYTNSDFHFGTKDDNPNRFDFSENTRPISNIGNIQVKNFGIAYIKTKADTIRAYSLQGYDCGHSIIYTPNPTLDNQPNAGKCNFNFQVGLTVQNAKNAAFYFSEARKINTAGNNNLSIGEATIYSTKQYIYPTTCIQHLMPSPTIRIDDKFQVIVLPSIGNTSNIGQYTIRGRRETITIGGWTNDEIGKIELTNRNRKIEHWHDSKYSTLGDFATVGNLTWISNEIRTIEATEAIEPPTITNTHYIDYGTRQIKAESIEPPEYIGYAHTLTRPLTIELQGFESTEWLTRIIPEIQDIYPLSITGEVSATAKIEHLKRALYPAGQELEKYGTPQIFNLIQHINLNDTAEDGGIIPPDMRHGTKHRIENINKQIKTYGYYRERFGTTLLYNAGRAIKIESIDAIGFGDSFIADSIRKIHIESIYSLSTVKSHAIYNSARQIKIKSIKQPEPQVPSIHVENTRKYYRWITAGETTKIGDAFIDFGIRTIKPKGIKQPPIIDAELHLMKRYIDVGTQGIEANQFGLTSVEEHHSILKVWGIKADDKNLGKATIRNLTPEIKFRSKDQSEIGTHTIYNYIQHVKPQGFLDEQHTRSWIGYRDRKIHFTGIKSLNIGENTRIYQGVSPPYTTQYITLDAIYNGEQQTEQGRGIFMHNGEADRFGRITFLDNTIYPHYFIDEKFGNANIQNNAIQIISGIYAHYFGEPFFKHPQYIKPYSIFTADDKKIGRIRISPHTIYLVYGEEATAQAIENHPTKNGRHYMGDILPTQMYRKIGTATITNQHRSIKQQWYHQLTAFGTANIFNDKNYIKPKGYTATRYGLASIPFTPQKIILPTRNTKEQTAIGRAEIKIPNGTNQYIRLSAKNSLTFGKHEIQNQHRHIQIKGQDSLTFGRSEPNDTKHMHQHLYIGFPDNPIIGGGELTQWGTTWISNHIRYIETDGHDSFICRYDRKKFKERMQIKRATNNAPIVKPTATMQQIKPTGIEPINHHGHTAGIPNIRLKVRYIYQTGNTDHYRKGANNANHTNKPNA